MKQSRNLLLIFVLILSLTLFTLRLIPMPESGTPPAVATEPAQTAPPPAPPSTTLPPETAPAETEPAQTEPPPLQAELPEPEDRDFVRVRDYIPDILVELRYATQDNFTGQVIYDFQELWLRYGTVKKLSQVQSVLREQGMG